MDGMTMKVPFHLHGTLSADATLRYYVDKPCSLTRVDTIGTANVTSSLKVGTPADDDGFITAFTPGANNAWVSKDRGDFNGALCSNGECPHLEAGTTILLTFTHASASHVDVILTLTEG
jgi:hypothetical protein